MRIILADDHVIFREGLKMLLSQSPEFTVVAEAGEASALKALVQEHTPDLLVLDYHMPGNDTAAVVAWLRQRHPALRIVMLTAAQSGTVLQQLVDAGADGVLLKEGSADAILHALRRVARGEKVVAERAKAQIQQAQVSLTAREFQMLEMIHNGHSSAAIAERFALSVRTVDKHRENLMRKLDVNSSAQLIAKARELNLL
ncbi:response regulator transcription factor [Chitinimonas sp. BJYL2]|uniref:response regulator n=1 Tax=Chitinimonas sp. BJYL2 TaxID=2976696 RepID=UPI0022B3690A|nr:response regulator transcription factor [Chitinimonas sp. BJYL2]